MTNTIKSLLVNSHVLLTAFLIASLITGPNAAWALDAGTLPSGGQITAGSGTISTSDSAMTVTQSTDKMVAQWDSFNIGQNASVQFVQPNVSSAALNRILDQSPSQILGQLNANGQVFLLNPAGIIFGQTSQVNVGSLVASSLNMTDENFLNGTYRFTGNGASGQISNLGDVATTEGGVVALIGSKAVNEGSITAPKGSAALIAGEDVTLDFVGDGLINYSVEQGAIDALAANSGLIKADGGLVVMTAEAANELTSAVVNNDGVIEAQTLADREGKILLLADMEYGETIVSGTLDASAPNGGDGGFIETSAATVSMAAGLIVTAGSAYGLGGEWLIDPYNFTIDATAAGNISTALNGGTSVTVDTATDNTSYGSSGSSSDIGDITVASAITKASGNTDVTLTLNAANSIVVDQAISNTGGTGKLNVVLDADNDSGTGDGAGIVMLNADITTNGGSLSFGTGRTATINGVSTLVGGDVYVAGSGARTISTNSGAVSVQGEMIIANSSGLTINSNGGNVRFYGLLNSGNSYSYDSTLRDWNDALTAAKSGAGDGVGDSYLATITTRLENAVVSRASNYQSSWLGGHRGVTDGTSGGTTLDADWRWVSGPEGLANGGDGTIFYHQTGTASGTAYGYTNWNSGEPNNCSTSACGLTDYTLTGGEQALQFTGNSGVWNDEPDGIWRSRQLGSNIETNLAASPLTINAATGSVQFDGAIGSSKALDTLTVTASGGIAINGGSVTTEGVQTYNNDITLGAAATTLTQTDADTDFTLQSNGAIANATGSAAALTIKTTGNIIMETSSEIMSTAGSLDTTLWADSDATNGGYIHIKNNSAIKTNGGDISLVGGTDGNGYAEGTSTQTTDPPHQDGISIYGSALDSRVYVAGTPQTSGGGAITLKGKGYAGNLVNHGGGLWAGYGSIYTGGGDLIMDVQAQENGGATEVGIRYGAFLDGITISTEGGNVQISTASPNSTWTGFHSNSSIAAGAGDITLLTDQISLNGATFSGTGTLTIQPITSGTTIGIAGGAGTLNISATEWGDFQNGFSLITIGDSTSGAITVGGTLTSNDDLILINDSTIAINGALTVNDNLTMTSGGAITQTQALDVNGTTTITAGSGNNVTLNNTGNDFTGAVTVVSGNDVSLRDSGALALAASTISGDLALVSAGNITQTGALSVTGTTSITAGSANDVTLGSGNNFTGAVSIVSGNNVTIADMNALVFGESTISGTLDVATVSGSVTQTGALSVAGLASFTSLGSNNDITLSDAGNDFSAVHIAQGRNVSLRDTDAMTLGNTNGTSTVTGNLSVQTGGDLTQGSNNGQSVAGTTDITAGGSNVTLTGVNSFSGGVRVVSANNVSLKQQHSATDLVLGNANGSSSVSGTLSVENTLSSTTQSGAYSVAGTTTITAGSQNVTLGSADNSFGGVFTAASVGDLSLTNSNAMSLGAVTSTGTVDVATLSGDLTLTGVVSTNDTTASAVTLNAGQSSAAGTVTGGDILVSGGSVSLTGGGAARATLYSGDISDSTGLTALVGSGSGNFRYNSDETTDFTSGSWTALGAGTYAVYREQPTLTYTANNETMTYGASSSATATLSGLQNGDTTGQAISTSATVAVGGSTSTSGKYTAGSHTLTPSGAAGGLGYGFSYTAGTLTVNQLDLNVTGLLANDKVYDGTTVATLTGTAVVSQLSGDDVSVGGTAAGAFADKNVGSNKAVTVSGVTISGTDAGNYNLIQQAGLTADISQLDLSVTGLTASDKVYDGTTVATLTGTAAVSQLSGDDVSVGGTAVGSFADANVGTNKTVTIAGVTIGGSDAGNYNLLQQSGLTADITAAENDSSGSSSAQGGSQVVVAQVISNVVSPQGSVNGTQQALSEGLPERSMRRMGPGAGAGVFEASSIGQLIIDRTGYRDEDGALPL